MTDKQQPVAWAVYKGDECLRVHEKREWAEDWARAEANFGSVGPYHIRELFAAPPAQPDHQGHSCTHKCTWPQCEAAQPAPAQEPQPVSNTDELPQRLSDERIRSCVEAAGPRDESTLKKAVAWYRRFADQIEAAIVPPGYVVVPVEIVSRFPEINPSNYGPDEVDALNAWGIELAAAAAPKASHDPR